MSFAIVSPLDAAKKLLGRATRVLNTSDQVVRGREELRMPCRGMHTTGEAPSALSFDPEQSGKRA
jgi:hypothetical protein